MLPDLYPGMKQLVDPLSMSTGKMEAVGVTVHYLAEVTVASALKSLRAEGLGYHVIIDRDGKIFQTCYFSHSVAHAGVAKWNGKSPNRCHVAVAVASWGAVGLKNGKFYSWAGHEIPASEVARRRGNRGKDLYHWHAATAGQEASLMMFLRWAVSKGIKPEDICGHDECAIPEGRKADPGGVISMTMGELREVLKTKPGS
jgi:N-acetyl-anhydromuramyl-L-alanine amidase AmpD